MENQINLPCEWDHCGAPASKHMRFGLRVFDAVGGIHISDIPYVPEHRDVCDKHALRARNEYVHASEYALGECPKCGQEDNSATYHAVLAASYHTRTISKTFHLK